MPAAFSRLFLVVSCHPTQRRNTFFFFFFVTTPGKVCVCYTSDLQTSSIFTVDYYKGVAKSAAEAGAHMIGIKVSFFNRRRFVPVEVESYSPLMRACERAGRPQTAVALSKRKLVECPPLYVRFGRV